MARADEITVKGKVLTGKVVGIDADGLKFETDYGDGTITIPVADIESISSEEEFNVVYGDDGEAAGKILSVNEGKVLIGPDIQSAELVDPADILDSKSGAERSWIEEQQATFRYWSGFYDLAFSYADESTDEIDVINSLQLERIKDPTRLLINVNYTFGKTDAPGQDSVKSDNELLALVKGEYDFTDRLFGYVSNDFENDELEQLSLRWVSKIGPGYKFIKNDNTVLRGEIGASYVYRRFHGGDVEEYGAVAFGLELDTKVFTDHQFRLRADYLPSLKEWEDDYLLRATATYLIPITTFIATRWQIINIYDNTPDEGTQRNEFQLNFGLSLRF